MAEIEDITRGNTRDIYQTVYDVDDVIFNITGYTIKMYVKKNLSDSAYIMDLTGSVLNGALGTLKIPMTITNTDQEPGKYHYSIEINDGTTDVYAVKNSTFEIVQGAK